MLRPDGRLLFTDAHVLTGPISKPEFDLRALPQGAYLLVPAGCNEAAIDAAGPALLELTDITDATATIAQGLHDARARHAEELGLDEDAAWFASRQSFLAITAKLGPKSRQSELGARPRFRLG